ncbi:MAG TPA: hypothetical protein PKD85_17350 [Saprospiraceae bacterium]|nr:hypothetical protein [Saprospiraceae bacterium]
MSITRVLLVVVGIIYCALIILSFQSPQKKIYQLLKSENISDDEHYDVLDTTLLLSMHQFDFQTPYLQSSISIAERYDSTKVSTTKYSYLHNDVAIRYHIASPQLSIKTSLEEPLDKMFRYKSGLPMLNIETQSASYINIGKLSQTTIKGSAMSKKMGTLRIDVGEYAHVSLDYLKLDTLIVTSKCFSTLSFNACKIGYLQHTVYGGIISNNRSKVKKVWIEKKKDMPCATEYYTPFSYEMEAHLGNDSDMIFAYRSQLPPQLKNHSKSTIIKILR